MNKHQKFCFIKLQLHETLSGIQVGQQGFLTYALEFLLQMF